VNPIFDEEAPKKPTNLSINSDLLAKSRDMQINLSALLESALKAKLAVAENENWKQNNKLAIKAYNSLVDEHGCFGDSIRDF
jgi:antitoxin CcdA